MPASCVVHVSTPRCEVSFEPYTHRGPSQPVFLPDCGHTYARKTVEDLFEFRENGQTSIRCPLCKTPQTSLPSAAAAKPNWYIMQHLPDPHREPDHAAAVSNQLPSSVHNSRGSGSAPEQATSVSNQRPSPHFLFWIIKGLLPPALFLAFLSYMFLGSAWIPFIAFLKITRISTVMLNHSTKLAALLVKLHSFVFSFHFSTMILILLSSPCLAWMLASLRS